MALTKKDIRMLKEIFPTREEVDVRFEEMNTRFDQVMKMLDHFVKMVETNRQEDIIARAEDRRRDRVLDNHETRFSTLEKTVA